MAADFIKTIAAMHQAQTRVVEALGVPYADPFNEEAIIADVNDPEKLGRVKVTTRDGITSDTWIPVSGSSSGTLSARYIGAQVLVGKTDGRSENMYVIGITRSDPEIGINGHPIQLPIIDESMAVWNASTDAGMKCNQGNAGRVYILSNEMNQDVVVCLRRTSNQVGSKPAWAWKSLTNGLWVEKGFNPGNESTPAITQAQRGNPGIPECSEALLGEVHEFTEDRGFRTMSMVCRRDENKNFSWSPLGTPPVFFRTTLPTCTEKVHGMEAVLDDGNNSEFMVCQRYQGLMRWVRHGRRIPHKFYSKEPPLSRVQFTTSFKDIKALEESKEPDENEKWQQAADIIDVALDTTMSDIPLTGTDPDLKKLLELAGMVPATAFNGAQTMRRVASEALRKRTGLPLETITQLIREDLDRDGALTPATSKALVGIGSTLDVLVNGVADGDIEKALTNIGTSTLRNALLTLEPRTASVMTGLMSGGISGAIDSAVAIGLDQLPPEVNKYAAPVIGIAKNLLLSKYPASLDGIINSAAGGGLLGAISSTINGAAKNNIVTPQLLGTLATSLADGSLGEIPKLFNSLSGLDSIVKTPLSLGSLPVLATTAMGLIGQANAMKDLFGNGGIGLDNLDQLLGTGFSAAATIVGAVKGLASIFGNSGGGLGCPCDPKCRKTKHGEDSDGNNIVEKCGAMTANNANSYSPSGNPLQNNIGPIALDLALKATDVGAELIPKNIRDLSGYIKTVARAKDMAEKVFSSRFADQTEKIAEEAYSAEAVEKGLKIADNNITRVESVEKKLIDSMYNMLGTIVYGQKSKAAQTAIIPQLIQDVRENSQAMKDLYKFVEKLDSVKNGGSAGVKITSSLAKSFQNIPDLSALNNLNRKEALKILRGGVTSAYKEWKTMGPGLGISTALGVYDPPIPDPYANERTLFDKNRILAISAESKLGDNSPPVERTLLDMALSPDQGESSLYDAVTGREGQSSCE